MTPRIIAIDWSGDLRGAARKIWLAEAGPDGQVIRLEAGRDAGAVVRHIVDEARRTPDLVVGFDFVFSLPAWFLTDRQLVDAPALWDLVSREGERWLVDCDPPFWGRAGRTRPDLKEHLRRTDREVPATGGIRPKSVFQINGGGSVGTGSIRGMPFLKQLRDAGFSVWPFDGARFPMVVEIYPRVLTGPVVKASADERRKFLEDHYPDLARGVKDDAARSDDAFDALVAALVMAKNASKFISLPAAEDVDRRLEGQIWLPEGTPAPTSAARGRYNSSKTRVAPVFSALKERASANYHWLRGLLDLAAGPRQQVRPWRTQDLAVQAIHYEPKEWPLQPPIALLSWLIRNFDPQAGKLKGNDAVTRKRQKLAARDPATIEAALDRLRHAGTGNGWHVLEGPTCPDVFIVTPDALVVVEGKRTEAGPTTSTSWMAGRHQMLRHLDAAWEIRGARAVYGVLIVESKDTNGAVPQPWVDAADDTVCETSIRSSLPHRSSEERAGIAAAFVGVTTWQAVVAAFDLDPSVLVTTVEALNSRA